jgi:hypothetical protein
MAIKNETEQLISEESGVVKLLSNALSKKLCNNNKNFLLIKCGQKKINPQCHTYMGNIFPLTHDTISTINPSHIPSIKSDFLSTVRPTDIKERRGLCQYLK